MRKPVVLPPCRAMLSTIPSRVHDLHEHNRYGTGCLLLWPHCDATRSQNNLRRKCQKRRREFAKAIIVTMGPARLDPRVAALDPSQFFQTLFEPRVPES
jgi:hypothetical protein